MAQKRIVTITPVETKKSNGLSDLIAIPIIVVGVYLLDKFLNG